MAEQDVARGGGAAGGKSAATIDLVAQALGAAREAGGACFVIGAGVSVSAGVPSSADLAARARARFPESWRHAQPAAGGHAPTSPHFVLGHLSLGERRALIGEALGEARLNWEHLVLAELMALGHIGPVFTTNFDTLLEDACVRAGVAPMVYDLSTGTGPGPWSVAGGPAIFHLNGVRDRVTTDDGEEARARQHRRIEPLVRHVLDRGVPIVVIGHRGEASPLVDLLAGHDRFANRLFWVAHFDHALSNTARTLVDKANNDALLLERYDAEGLMIELARKLDAFPPRFVANPYAAVLRSWETIVPPTDAGAAAPFEAAVAGLWRSAASIDGGTGKAGPGAARESDRPVSTPVPGPVPGPDTDAGRSEDEGPPSDRPLRFTAAPEEHEPMPEPEPGPAPEPEPGPRIAPPAPEEILAGLAAERYERLIKGAEPEAPPVPDAGPDERTVERSEERARGVHDGEETPARLRLVIGDYRRLVDDFEAGRLDDIEDVSVIAWAYVMLGNEDAKLALTAFGPEAEPLWASATSNYGAALRIDPRHADAFYNWASAAASRAQGLKGAASERLWNEAVSHFERALEVRPDDTEALGDCARALVAKARTMTAPRADELLDRALDLLAHAYRLGDDMAYVGYVEVALAHARHSRLVEFMNERPKRLSDSGYFALALAQVVFTLERRGAVDLAPFDELPARDEAPCSDWDFAEIEPALHRLPAADADFVHSLIAVLQGSRPSGDWPALRDSWIAVNPERAPVSSAGSF